MTIPAVSLEWTPTLRELSNHLWQSTLFACLIGLLALALHKHQARTRHWLWLAASLKFLVPFSLLIALGTHLPHPTHHAAPQATTYAAIDTIQPFAEASTALPLPPQPILPQRPTISITTILLALWITGSLAVFTYWLIQWRRISAIAHAAQPLLEGREHTILLALQPLVVPGAPKSGPLGPRVPRSVASSPTLGILLTQELIEPGVFGILRPVLLWPANISAYLDDAHLTAVLAHELTHVRRRDNLTSALHILTATLFWFHPLVWFIGRRLIHERECACDEHVLALHTVPHIYAESILKICELSLESPIPCVSGITGAGLRQRITHIVTHPTTLRLGPAAKLTLTTLALATLTIPILLGAQSAPTTEDWAKAAGTKIEFDAASVRLDEEPIERLDPSTHPKSNVELNAENFYMPTGGRLSAKKQQLITYIVFAYKLTGSQELYLRSHVPKWVTTERFDIEAKAADANPSKDQLRLMMQSLLSDRFKLVVHKETQQLPVLALVLAKPGKLGPDLRAHPANDPVCSSTDPLKPVTGTRVPAGDGGFPVACNWIAWMRPGACTGPCMKKGGRAVTMSQIAAALPDMEDPGLENPVIDRTGLAGTYDFTLQLEIVGGSMTEAGKSDSSPMFLPTLEDQLGLKLKKDQGPVEVLVLDHIDHPTPQNAAQLIDPTPPTQPHPTTPKPSPKLQRVAFAQPQVTQGPASESPKLPKWETISIHPNKEGCGGDCMHMHGTDDAVTITNSTVYQLLLLGFHLRKDQLFNEPAWTHTLGFDIAAKVGGEDVPAYTHLRGTRVYAMLQQILYERFNLAVHHEIRTLPVYALMVAKEGSKLTPAESDTGSSIDGSGTMLKATDATIDNLLPELSRILGRSVVDRTGLTGKYDFDLHWTPDDASRSTDTGPSIFTAVHEQLGLKLELIKAPTDVLVIDHLDHPTEN